MRYKIIAIVLFLLLLSNSGEAYTLNEPLHEQSFNNWTINITFDNVTERNNIYAKITAQKHPNVKKFDFVNIDGLTYRAWGSLKDYSKMINRVCDNCSSWYLNGSWENIEIYDVHDGYKNAVVYYTGTYRKSDRWINVTDYTDLPHWNESTTAVWINLTSNESQIGRAVNFTNSYNSASNGTNTFIIFSNQNDITSWVNSGSTTISNLSGDLRFVMTGATAGAYKVFPDISYDTITETLFKSVNYVGTDHVTIELTDGAPPTNLFMKCWQMDTQTSLFYDPTGNIWTEYTEGTYYIAKNVIRNSASKMDYYIYTTGYNLLYTITNLAYAAGSPINFNRIYFGAIAGTGNGDIRVTWVRTRKYTAIEPTIIYNTTISYPTPTPTPTGTSVTPTPTGTSVPEGYNLTTYLNHTYQLENTINQTLYAIPSNNTYLLVYPYRQDLLISLLMLNTFCLLFVVIYIIYKESMK